MIILFIIIDFNNEKIAKKNNQKYNSIGKIFNGSLFVLCIFFIIYFWKVGWGLAVVYFK
jgi:hypothetical protein